MTHRQIAEIARLPTEHVTAIVGGAGTTVSSRTPGSTDPAARRTSPAHAQRPRPKADGPGHTEPPPHERRPPKRQPQAPRRARDSERWRRITKRALALIGTVFVGLPAGLIGAIFLVAAGVSLATGGPLLVRLLLLGVLTACIAWRVVQRLRRIARAARDQDESWLAVRTVRAKQGSLRDVSDEHGILGVCAAVVLLAVFAWRAGKPPRGERQVRRSIRRLAGRLMTVLGSLVVIVFAAGGVAIVAQALTGSETASSVAGYAVIAACTGWGAVAVRRRRRARARTA